MNKPRISSTKELGNSSKRVLKSFNLYSVGATNKRRRKEEALKSGEMSKKDRKP